MKGIWKKVSSIGLVIVLVATLLMSFPFVSAKPPDASELIKRYRPLAQNDSWGT